jgi:hypothetical protein
MNHGTNLHDVGLGKYIVVFEKGLDTPENIVKDVEKKLTGLGGTITYEYNTVLRGFAVTIPTDVMETFQKEEMTSLQNDKFPFYIEKDQVVSINNDDDGKN